MRQEEKQTKKVKGIKEKGMSCFFFFLFPLSLCLSALAPLFLYTFALFFSASFSPRRPNHVRARRVARSTDEKRGGRA